MRASWVTVREFEWRSRRAAHNTPVAGRRRERRVRSKDRQCCNRGKSDDAGTSWVAGEVGEGVRTWVHVESRAKRTCGQIGCGV